MIRFVLSLAAVGSISTISADVEMPHLIGAWPLLLGTALATFISEDLTLIATGLLVADGRAGLVVGLSGCFLGIFLSDLGLWLLGRVAGQPALNWSWVRRRLPVERLVAIGQWLDTHCGKAVFTARFLPGTRLPFYLAAGILGRQSGRFIAWTFVAALVWTPFVVLSVVWFGGALGATGWLSMLVGVLLGLVLCRVGTSCLTRVGRGRVLATVARLWRWEFWPTRLFYLPVLPWLAWLSLRYRSTTVWTAANPGIPDGGVVGESKHAILAQLPAERVIPNFLIESGPIDERMRQFLRDMAERAWAYPLIFKPDASQRGAGVKKVRDAVEAEKYLRNQEDAVVVQLYHAGPFEAGLFYYRLPGEEKGHVFSITDKVFPVLVGDGCSTLEELIWTHPRYRMQANTFLTRHANEARRVLAIGERFPLALAGNHCQGTLFRDGEHLRTPELEAAVDEIAHRFPGFFIGRFDVRYTNVADFKAGRDLAIVELNGVTSESTNIYDPDRSLFAAYRTLYRQWSLLFRIGHANRQHGHQPPGLWALLRSVQTYYRGRRIDPLAD